MQLESCPKCGADAYQQTLEQVAPPNDDELTELSPSLLQILHLYHTLRRDEGGCVDTWGAGRQCLDEVGIMDPLQRKRILRWWLVIDQELMDQRARRWERRREDN